MQWLKCSRADEAGLRLAYLGIAMLTELSEGSPLSLNTALCSLQYPGYVTLDEMKYARRQCLGRCWCWKFWGFFSPILILKGTKNIEDSIEESKYLWKIWWILSSVTANTGERFGNEPMTCTRIIEKGYSLQPLHGKSRLSQGNIK